SHYFPLAYLALGPAFRVLDVRMEEAGLVSGSRYWHILWRISFALLRPAILRHCQRAQHHALGDPPCRDLFLPARHAPRRSVCHHHRQRLYADAHQSRPLALAGDARYRSSVFDRARAAVADAAVAILLP